MTGACPRCRAPLSGPYCNACGLQLQTAPPPSPYAPPGYVPPGYAPPQGQMPQGYPPQQPMYAPPPMGHPYGQPGMPYMAPGGQYVMMQAPNQMPSKRWAMVGGVMDIVSSSIYLLLGLLAAVGLSNEHGNDKGGAMVAVFVFILLGIAGIVFGVYSTRGRWGGALGGGILHSVFALICFIGIGGIQEVKDRHRMDYGGYYERSRDKDLDAISGFLTLLALLSIVTLVFSFMGVRGAKAHARYQEHMRATGAF